MKKITLSVAVLAVAALTLSSCAKEYTCECSVNGSSIGTTTKEFKKKADAEAWCNQSTTSGGVTSSCKLK